jgi:creatinine amidohydrolase
MWLRDHRSSQNMVPVLSWIVAGSNDVALTIWNESTRVELGAVLGGSVVVLPTGATEQHGPHLVTGHDTFLVSHIARAASERAAATCDVVLTPALPFGSSAHHLTFGGTLSLSTDTYYQVVRDLVESILEDGGRKVLLLNGHGGNHELNELVARDVSIEQSPESGVVLAAASYWDIARAAVAADDRFGGIMMPGHAGQFETATMLALDPTRVRDREVRERDPSLTNGIPGVRVEAADRWESFDGFTDFPHLATADQGAALLEVVVQEVAGAIVSIAQR